MNMLSKLVGAFLAAGMMAGAAQAAEPIQLAALSSVEGKVLVHKGGSYTIAKSGAPLVAGDRVITLKGAKADIAYKGGCVTSVSENAVLAIGGADVCANGPVSTAAEPVKYAAAIGGTQVSGGGAAAEGGISGGLVFGTVAATTTLGGAASLRNSNNNNPASGE